LKKGEVSAIDGDFAMRSLKERLRDSDWGTGFLSVAWEELTSAPVIIARFLRFSPITFFPVSPRQCPIPGVILAKYGEKFETGRCEKNYIEVNALPQNDSKAPSPNEIA
jgi:hypothetical protein